MVMISQFFTFALLYGIGRKTLNKSPIFYPKNALGIFIGFFLVIVIYSTYYFYRKG
jgi:hypothetical protein